MVGEVGAVEAVDDGDASAAASDTARPVEEPPTDEPGASTEVGDGALPDDGGSAPQHEEMIEIENIVSLSSQGYFPL